MTALANLLSGLGQDLRFASRQIGRAPAFAVTAVLTLALGTGVNTAIFGVINGFVRPLPVPDADRLVVLARHAPGDDHGFGYRFSYPALVDFREQARGFSSFFAFDLRIAGLTAGGKTTQFVYHSVTGNFFSGLGLTAARGRLIRPSEGESVATESVLVLGYACWLNRFGGDPNVIDTMVRIDGQPARIIGVAPAGFHGMVEGAEMEGYMPFGTERGRGISVSQLLVDRSRHYLTIAGKLDPGVSLARAQAEIDTVTRRLEALYPATEKGVTAAVMPETLARPFPLPFLSEVLPTIKALLFALAGLVLLIACMNVANLLLVRATVRQREIAVRAALGAGRRRLIRLLLAESLVLAALGAAVGLLAGHWALSLFLGSLSLSGTWVPIHVDWSGIDWPVFGYTLAIAVATGVVIGIVPAFRASRVKIIALLHDGGRSDSADAGRQRLRSVLVMAQVAGSVMLLIIAGLFVRNLHRAESIDLGFDPRHVLNVRLDPHQVGYDTARTSAFYRELDRRVHALPGVSSAAFAFSVPMGPIFAACPVESEGAVIQPGEPRPAVGYNTVSPSYFDTVRMPIVRGRAFRDSDTAQSPRVAIVNELLAGRLWPNQDPIGKRLVEHCEAADTPWLVVGVAKNSKYLAVFEAPLPYMYLPDAQNPSFMRVLQMRSELPPETLEASVRREIDALDPEIPFVVETMQQSVSGGVGFLLFRVGALQATTMGVLGLLLGVVGLYGVVSYGARQREREIGIRLALGASPGDVRRLVLGQGVTLVVGGIAAGLVAAALATRMIQRLVFLVSATDPLTFISVIVLLAAVALVACYLPARRATRVDPMVALRHE